MFLVFILVGLCCIAVAVFDPDFVMEGRKVRSMVALVGRGTMRGVYALVGLAMVAAGAALAAGLLPR
jgi:hypothetical protein